MKRLLVTGSRHFDNEAQVRKELARAYLGFGLDGVWRTTLVVGGAKGADELARRIWHNEFNLPTEIHLADWAKYGKYAGPHRNQEMVAAGADLCLAFFDEHPNKGTHHCVSIAEAAGIPVRRIQKEGT